MSKLFERAWSLEVYPPVGGKGIEFKSDYSQGEPLRFAFQIERTLHSDSNKAELTLTNLQPKDRQFLGLGMLVRLRAGYGTAPGIIFLGHIAEIEMSQDGPDLHASIKCGDGEPYLQSGFVSLTYRSTTTLARILEDICKQLRVEINGQVFQYEGHIVQQVPKITLTRRVISGPVKKVLDDLLHPLQMQWSIQCGTLLIQYDKGVVSLKATVLSYRTGLIGVPTRTKGGVKCSALLQSSIAPGLAVNLDASVGECKGNFRVVSAMYKGDTGGKDWTVDVDAEALKATLEPYVKATSQGAFDGATAEVGEAEIEEGATE